jgi:peptide/nickel transport system permease protein
MNGVTPLRTAKFSYLKAIGIRLLAGIPVFLLVTFSATALSSFIPGSAAQLILGDNATQEQIVALNTRYGYDRPLIERYLDWLTRLLHGDLGQTMFSQQSVAGLLFDRTAVTFEIAFLAMFVSLLIGVPLAMYAASRPRGIVDTMLHAVSSVMLSVPTFVIVVLLGFVFAIVLRWLPATGWVPLSEDPLGNLQYVALPVMCLSVHQAAYFYRVARSEFVAILQEDYVLVARAKGLPMHYILLRHVLRPAFPQVLTVMGLSMTYLLGGSFIVESYFAVPGIGWTVLSAMTTHDLPVMQAILSLTVVIFVAIFILVDLGYALIDPRVNVS